MRRPWLGRAVVLGVAILLMAPTPGSVGSCGEDASAASAQQFCKEKGAWECARMNARGEFPSLEYADVQACVDGVPDACDGINWPPTCDPPPTNIQTDACISALTLPENLNIPTDMIPACTIAALCGSAAAALIDADGGVGR